jgi:hypothetical protein
MRACSEDPLTMGFYTSNVGVHDSRKLSAVTNSGTVGLIR